jgi:hypothetical protein
VKEQEQALVRVALERLRPLGLELIDAGWRPEVIAMAPSEIERIPGYKVALVVPIESIPDEKEAA